MAEKSFLPHCSQATSTPLVTLHVPSDQGPCSMCQNLEAQLGTFPPPPFPTAGFLGFCGRHVTLEDPAAIQSSGTGFLGVRRVGCGDPRNVSVVHLSASIIGCSLGTDHTRCGCPIPSWVTPQSVAFDSFRYCVTFE